MTEELLPELGNCDWCSLGLWISSVRVLKLLILTAVASHLSSIGWLILPCRAGRCLFHKKCVRKRCPKKSNQPAKPNKAYLCPKTYRKSSFPCSTGNWQLLWHSKNLWVRKTLLGIKDLSCVSFVKAKNTIYAVSNRSYEDRTQTGHILGDAQHREVVGVSDRGMSPAVFILIRLLTHLTMLLGATEDPQVSSSSSSKQPHEV